MPRVKVAIDFKLNLRDDGFNVNTFFKQTGNFSNQLTKRLFKEILVFIQKRILGQVLGDRWKSIIQTEAPWCCKGCGSNKFQNELI